MAGVVAPDEGRMLLDGRDVRFTSPAEANAAGIACIFQELSLVPDLSVADNIAISDPPRRFGLIDRSAQRAIAEEALARAGAEDIHPRALVKDLPLSRRQMVEIAKALAWKPRILILDEATSALTASDVAKVFAVLKRLRSEGLALLYISHRMHEIAELADECTVFRNGRNVASYKAGTRTDNEVVEMMIGREYKQRLSAQAGARSPARTPPALECRQLGWTDRLRDISFSVGARRGRRPRRPGWAGPARTSAGAVRRAARHHRHSAGRRRAGGHRQPGQRAARQRIGMALIPEDRKTEGLMLPMTVRENLSFAVLDRVSKGGIIDRDKEERLIDEMVQLLAIKTAGLDIPVGALSGGNQQKVVIAKWLMRKPRIILLNDPTRGIDVGTKQEIYQLLRRLADAGAAILFYSTDYDELIGCCDRVLVLYDGRIVRELEGDRITEHALIASALKCRGDQAAGCGGMNEWRYWLAEQRGTLMAVGIFAVMFLIYVANHPAGFTANVVQTASNKGVLLAFVAMAQTLVVITAGIDLSVGMIFILTNCLASWLVVGTALETAFGVIAVLGTGLACGALNGADRHRRTPAADRRHHRDRRHLFRPRPAAAAVSGRLGQRGPGRRADRPAVRRRTRKPGRAARRRAGRLGAVQPFGDRPRRLCLGLLRDRRLHVRRADPPRQVRRLYAGRACSPRSAGCSSPSSPIRARRPCQRQRLYAVLDRGRRARRRVAVRRQGSAIGAIFGALAFRTIGDLLFVFDFDPLWQPLFQGVVLLVAVSLGAFGLFRVRNRLEWFG